jgi:tetratricopeptide (TPR) repeat protein
MNNCLRPIVLLSSVLAIGYTLPAVALSPVEIQRIAKQATVRIKDCDNGSGVIIQKSGNTYTILTAAHATRASGCQVVTADDNEYKVTQVMPFINSVDLAVIRFNSTKNYKVAKLIDNSDLVESGENVYISGFPVTTAIVEPIFTFVSGKVIGNGNKLQKKGYSMVYDNPTLPGHSGGPVWNDKGEMIAIHGQGDIDSKLKDTDSPNVRIKTGFNLGITVNTFAKMASAMGMTERAPEIASVQSTEATESIPSKPPTAKPPTVAIKPSIAKSPTVATQPTVDIKPSSAKPPTVVKQPIASKPSTVTKPIIVATPPTQVVIAKPKPVDDLIASAVARESKGDYKGIVADMDRAIAIDPRKDRLYYMRGTAKSELGDKKGAIEDFDRDITMNPKRATAYHNRGMAKYQLGQWQQALADYNISIEINPQYHRAFYHRANAKYQLKDKQGALDDYSRAIALDPTLLAAYSSRGWVKYESGDYAGSISDNNLAIAMNHPLLSKVFSQKAFAQYELGDRSNAVLSWRKALSLPNIMPDSQLGLAIALYQQGRQEEAFQLGAAAIRTDKKLADIRSLRDKNWGQSILKDAASFLQHPRIQSIR